MIVRAIDGTGDWLYGKGRNDYRKDRAATSQMIATRLRSFLGDCFFAANEGLDWFNLLGAKDQIALRLAINSTILNTVGVTGLLETSYNLTNGRLVTITYKVQTIYGQVASIFQYDIPS